MSGGPARQVAGNTGGAWEAEAVGGRAPGARGGAAVAALQSPHGALLFGGQDGDPRGGGLLGDTWTYRRDLRQWTQNGHPGDGDLCREADSCPGPRAFASLHQVGLDAVLLGGACDVRGAAATGQGDPCIDVAWEFSLASNRWRPMDLAGTAPPRRSAHSAVAHKYSVFVHGGHRGPRPAGGWSAAEEAAAAGTVWELRFFDREWVRHDPAGFVNATGHVLPEVTFSDRYGHAGVHWESEGEEYLVFHGGVVKGHVSNDVLLFNLRTKVWQQKLFITAPFRAFHSLLVGSESLEPGAPEHLLTLLGFGHDAINIGMNFATAEVGASSAVVGFDLGLLLEGPSDAKWKAWRLSSGGGDAAPSARLAAGMAALDGNTVLAIGGFGCATDAVDRVPHLANVTDSNCGTALDGAWTLQINEPPDAKATVSVTTVDASGEPMAPQHLLISLSGTPVAQWSDQGAGTVSVPVGELLIECIHDGVLVAELRQFVTEDTAVNVQASEPIQMNFQLLRLDGSSPYQECTVLVEARSVLTQAWRTLPLGSLRTSQRGYVEFALHPSKQSSSPGRWGEYRLSAFENSLQVVSEVFQAEAGAQALHTVVSELQNSATLALELREQELPPGYSGGLQAVNGTLEAFQYSYIDVVFRDLEKWHEAQLNITLAVPKDVPPPAASDLHVYLSSDISAFPNNASFFLGGVEAERVECSVPSGSAEVACSVRRWNLRAATPYMPMRLGIAHKRPALDGSAFNLTAQIVTASAWQPPEETLEDAGSWRGTDLLSTARGSDSTLFIAVAAGGGALLLAALALVMLRRRKRRQTVLDSSPGRGLDTTWTGVGLGLSAGDASGQGGGRTAKNVLPGGGRAGGVGAGSSHDEQFMGNLERLAAEYRQNLAATGSGQAAAPPPPPSDSSSDTGSEPE